MIYHFDRLEKMRKCDNAPSLGDHRATGTRIHSWLKDTLGVSVRKTVLRLASSCTPRDTEQRNYCTHALENHAILKSPAAVGFLCSVSYYIVHQFFM